MMTSLGQGQGLRGSISAKNISKSFDGGKSFALKNVSVDIAPGEFVAIIGLSGAGKSTFLRSINGTVLPGEGAMEVLGNDFTRLSPKRIAELRREIGFIFQQFNLIKNRSVLKNVLMGRVASVALWRAMTGLFSANDCELAEQALAAVGIVGRSSELVRNLSGGQQQRVAIARALVQKPKIILADEPMASLDPKLSEVVLDILKEINEDQKITVLVNIHVLELARKYAHRILAFRQGQLVFDGKTSELTAEAVERIYDVPPGSSGGFH